MNPLISERLKEFFETYNLSIADVAEATGLTIDNVKNLRYGRSSKIEFLTKIADSYNISIDYLKKNRCRG